jgi:hypothetical protein
VIKQAAIEDAAERGGCKKLSQLRSWTHLSQLPGAPSLFFECSRMRRLSRRIVSPWLLPHQNDLLEGDMYESPDPIHRHIGWPWRDILYVPKPLSAE